ncbi:uncharacterized protein [Chelonus insularis]|uniref:uncharacterized protein n=1 Tax=Chelonus insularis TaxID=460826 RepID=UPI001588996F|nr:uncharacterized protein LOC118067437 [Chelonus insularis]XP_034940039.1 uncharacterized protein LOC118067437 [Chelonus insularis]
MIVPIKFFLLICAVEVVWAQFPDLNSDPIQKGPISRTSTRFFPRQQPSRSNVGPPSGINNQRIRRPIALKNRPASEANEISSFNPIRPKPTLLPLIKPENPSSPPQLQRDQPIKPVNEESKEEEEDANSPVIKPLNPVVIPQPQQVFPQQPSNLLSSPLTPRPEPIFQFRPNLNPTFIQPVQPPTRDENIPPVQYRPQKPVKLRKPIQEDDEVHISVKQQYQQPSINKQSYNKKAGYREKKPVAQAIRRWREDNDDGSITWGYENDDGSYKEEIIGVDCITRGKYGYIDLDGVKREYSYEMGIKCDEQEDEEESGFVDYQENKLVLPNGKTIDLSNMGKKQGRRPQPLYRN